MKKIFIISATISLQLLASQSMETIYLKNACNSCHGMYGEGMGSAPRLQGISADLLYKRLKNLQAGKTRSAFGTIMISFAKNLDENQTKQMAQYLFKLKKEEQEEVYDLEYDTAGDGGS